MKPIIKIAKKYNLKIIEDCAQAVGATIRKKKVGSFGFAGCFSFHPLKNLNAIGDGGMIVTKDKKFYSWLLKARNNGHPDRDHCDFWSHNMRLDALQAMFLEIKLKNYEKIIKLRNKNVNIYKKNLKGKLSIPKISKDCKSVYHTFIVKTKRREQLISYLKKNKIETKIHYPIPIHKLESFKKTNKKINLPVTEKLSKEIITLPVAEYLSCKDILYVVDNINKFFEK